MEDLAAQPFRFLVTAVFTITGRGLVAAGVTEQGTVRTGDLVQVVHEGQRRTATCRGVEMIYSQHPDFDRRTVGLVLPELSKADVAVGDVVEAAQTVP